jgi:hypothetical protein
MRDDQGEEAAGLALRQVGRVDVNRQSVSRNCFVRSDASFGLRNPLPSAA